MKLVLLGTGTPAPSRRRMGAGHLVDLGRAVIVFDHGPGAHQRLIEAGYRAQDVTHLFLTHHHYDHILDVPRLILTRWDHGPQDQPELVIAGPPPLVRMAGLMLGPDGLFAPDIAARIGSPVSVAVFRARGGTGERRWPVPRLRELAPGDDVAGDGWQVTAGPAYHAQPHLACLSYRLDCDGRSIVYSGDNGGVTDDFIAFAAGCDVLVHMTHFLAGTEYSADYRRMCAAHSDVAETARRAGARILVLTHLLPQLDTPGVGERMLAEMARVFDGTIILGADGMTVPLAPPAAAVAT